MTRLRRFLLAFVPIAILKKDFTGRQQRKIALSCTAPGNSKVNMIFPPIYDEDFDPQALSELF